MEQRSLFMTKKKDYSKLKSVIIGSKQAGSEWYNNLSSTMTKHGYTISRSDPCLFTKRRKNGD
jgi:hypothetical protein